MLLIWITIIIVTKMKVLAIISDILLVLGALFFLCSYTTENFYNLELSFIPVLVGGFIGLYVGEIEALEENK